MDDKAFNEFRASAIATWNIWAPWSYYGYVARKLAMFENLDNTPENIKFIYSMFNTSHQKLVEDGLNEVTKSALVVTIKA